jgi:response regulator of citrate/malate metabolism
MSTVEENENIGVFDIYLINPVKLFRFQLS